MEERFEHPSVVLFPAIAVVCLTSDHQPQLWSAESSAESVLLLPKIVFGSILVHLICVLMDLHTKSSFAVKRLFYCLVNWHKFYIQLFPVSASWSLAAVMCGVGKKLCSG